MRNLVNLRSDTQTLPTEAMLKAMDVAELGDDTYREDPTVVRLEEQVAGMLSMEASLLVLSGTMANLVSLMAHCVAGDAFFVDAGAHVIRSEAGGYAAVAGVTSAAGARRGGEMFFLLYFILTGVHAARMAIGVCLLTGLVGWTIAAGGPGALMVELTGLYWHFVDIVWIFLFPLLYLAGLHLCASRILHN